MLSSGTTPPPQLQSYKMDPSITSVASSTTTNTTNQYNQQIYGHSPRLDPNAMPSSGHGQIDSSQGRPPFMQGQGAGQVGDFWESCEII